MVESSKDKKISKKTKKAGWRLLRKVLLWTLILFVLLRFVLGYTIVHDNNMYPSVRDGDLCITFRMAHPVIENLVVYTVDGQQRVGRIVAVPGDKVNMDEDSYFTINDNVPYENIFYRTEPAEGGVPYPYVVNEDHYFILNDMRDDTNDSRLYGAIPKEDIQGVIVFQCRQRGF